MLWKLRTQTLQLAKPIFMGIVNVTPDSFSDGGCYFDTDTAVEHALELIKNGAGIIDLGGESTRPGSDSVPADEELRRLLPVIKILREKTALPLSVDTVKAAVAEKAVEAGAEIINDVSGLADADMLDVLRRTGAGYCLMHTQGIPKTMQLKPHYENAVEEVFEFLRNTRQMMLDSGIPAEKIAVDPGLGFGKTTQHNWQLVENMNRFLALDAPLLVGHSRKRFIAETFPDRNEGTRKVTQQLIKKGVHIIRLHEWEAAPR